MKELLIISGKGGTGKTSITAALAALADGKVLVDLDVDAPDMHLLLQPAVRQETAFVSGNIALVREESCTACGQCADVCSFDAIRFNNGSAAWIDQGSCEGCKLCVAICPEKAIDFPDRTCGNWFVSDTRLGPMVHARLNPGEENSGRLVSLLREHARKLAEENGLDLILADGTPGIGCPVISSLSGCHLALVVTEPTPSGRHDMLRVLELCAHFKVQPAVLINKADLNLDLSSEIETYCRENQIPALGKLNFDPGFVEAMVEGRLITETAPNGDTARSLAEVWDKLKEMLNGPS